MTDGSPSGGRLESWKAIAGYLERDTSTVRRWEKAEGLPVHRHMHDKQPTVYAYHAELDAWLESRCPKDPEAPSEVWIAVLPLENRSGDRSQDYFVQGMHEALLEDLSKIGSFKVISRRSVARYEGARRPIPEIARELGVDVIVEGSMLRVDDRARVSVQLIDGNSDEHLWAESYERDVRDVFRLQTELARTIASEIHVVLTPEDTDRLARSREVNLEAYEAYLKGRFHWNKLSPDHLETALEYFRLALKRHPRYALAHVGLADVWFSQGELGVTPPWEAFAHMKASVLDALALDDTLAEAHATLANVRFVHDWDMESAERAYRRAIELNPNFADGRFFYADFLISTGRSTDAMAELERALQLDPFNNLYLCFKGWYFLYLGRVDDAMLALERARKADPNFPAVTQGLWGVHGMRGAHEEALREAKRFFTLIGRQEVADVLSRGDRVTETDYRRAMSEAAERLAGRARKTHIGAVRVARLYAHAGDSEAALAWLERALAEREPALVHLAVSWDWRGLRDEPGYQDLLRRLKLSR